MLIHIIDISGTTNEKGEATTGYDPTNDCDWLISELNEWVFANLWVKWPGTGRKHAATKASAGATLSGCLSGYGGNRGGGLVASVLEALDVKVDKLWGSSST